MAKKTKATKTAKTGNRAAKAIELKVGQKAPDFTLPSDTGEKVSLKDFRGKKGCPLFLSKG
ncbi:AhpC/TSA family protein [Candidatus Kryptonium thompsonii]|nr:AhpC/TSA family protein [Candidatus Kryptonium thompsoni]